MTKKTRPVYFPTREIHREIHELSRRTHSKMFAYMLLIGLIEELILYPLARKLWLLSIKSTPDQFLSNGNFSTILQSPLVILCALFLAFNYCLLTLWETSGLILCIEYKYQDQPFNLFKMLQLAFRRIRHVFEAKNLLILPCTFIFSLCFNVFTTNELFSRIHVPEYIMEYLRSHVPLLVCGVLLSVIVYFLVLQSSFLYYYIVVYRMDFKQAVHQMRIDLKGKRTALRTTSAFMIVRLGLRIFIVPLAIFVVLAAAAIFPTAKLPGAILSVRILYMNLTPGIKRLCDVFLKIELLSIYTVLFHRIQTPESVEKFSVPLEEGCISGSRRTWRHTYRKPNFLSAYLLPIFSFLVSLGIVSLYLFLLLTFNTYPQGMLDILSRTKVVAHKGYSSVAPENTLPAFKSAVDTGKVDLIELDVRETIDGEIIVIHDGNLRKAANYNASVYYMTLNEIQSQNALYNFASKDGWKDTFVSVPTLRQVYEAYGDQANFLVELKASSHSPELVKKVVAIMEEYDRVDKDLVQSSDYASLRQVKECNENIQTGLIIAIGVGTYYYLPDVDFFSIEHTFLTSATVNSIHGIDKKVYVWTVNSESDMQDMVAMGVDGIITDRPETAYRSIHTYDDDLLALIAENLENDFEQLLPEENEIQPTLTPEDDY